MGRRMPIKTGPTQGGGRCRAATSPDRNLKNKDFVDAMISNLKRASQKRAQNVSRMFSKE
jgi:hypothetical protein